MAIRRLVGYFQPPLISFQMGKVGSSSIRDTIEADYRVHHLHTKEEMNLLLPILRKGRKHRFDLITATRDPVGREISVYFQNLLSRDYPFGCANLEEALSIGPEELAVRFKQRWQLGLVDTVEWFDRHFLPSTGVNVYDHPFDRNKGWSILETEEFRILIVRFEDIDRNYLEAINALAATRSSGPRSYPRMRSTNVSEKKWYGSLMKEFKSHVTFNNDEVDSLYNSRYCRHFYTDAEISLMRSRVRLSPKPNR